jgi:hypothetical protein
MGKAGILPIGYPPLLCSEAKGSYFFFSASSFFLTRAFTSFFMRARGSFSSKGKRTVALVVS